MRREMRAAAVALLALPGLPSGAASDGAPEVLAATRYAQVGGAERARGTAPHIAGVVDVIVPRAARLVGTADMRPVPVRVCVDLREFIRITATASFVVAPGAMAREGVIYLHLEGVGSSDELDREVTHEVAHVMLARAADDAEGEVPLWFNEGVAQYAEGASPLRADRLSAEAERAGKLRPISELGTFAFRQTDVIRQFGPEYAYAEAASLVHYLVAQHGEHVIADLLAATREQGQFAAALARVTGLTLPELESAWRNSLRQQWTWAAFVDINLLVWVVMVLLLGAAVLRYRRERRRRQEEAGAAGDW